VKYLPNGLPRANIAAFFSCTRIVY